jgi:hypothetical protein
MSAFWRYWSATAVSVAGSRVTALALPLVALTILDATPLQAGLVVSMNWIGWALLGLPAGAICERLPLRAVQITTDLVRALAIGSVPVSWAVGLLSVGQLVVVAATVSVCTVLFDVSNSTYLPAIVEAGELQNRNAWMSGLSATAETAGPSGAGLLVQAIGPVVALIVDAVSYLGSALILRSVPTRRRALTDERASIVSMIQQGWTYVVGQPIMRACLLDATASNFVAGGLMVLLPLVIVRDYGHGPLVLGLLLGAEGLGGLLGAALVGRVSVRSGTARATLLAAVAGWGFVLLVPFGIWMQQLFIAAVGSAGWSATNAVRSINTRTFRQLESPPELLGRVMATVRFVSWGVIPIGSFLAGLVATSIGSIQTLTVYCLLVAASPLALLASPVRGRRDLRPVDPKPVGAGR